jgi:hypothetical protein
MKTGQMLFVALGGIMLGAAGTLAVQTGLLHYEISIDIRPRGLVTLPPPALSTASTTGDPYLAPPSVQNWEPAPLDSLPVAMPPLDDQQIAEIVSLREQIGHSVSQKLNDLASSEEEPSADRFADHLRAAVGRKPASPQTEEVLCPASPLCPAEENSLARGLREAQLR